MNDIATDNHTHAIACEIFLANPEVLKNSQFMSYLSPRVTPCLST